MNSLKDIGVFSTFGVRIYQEAHTQMFCENLFNLPFICDSEKVEQVQIAILSLYHNQVMKNADATAEQDGPAASGSFCPWAACLVPGAHGGIISH